jgi:hypothetical protein
MLYPPTYTVNLKNSYFLQPISYLIFIIQYSDWFKSIKAAYKAIKAFVLNKGEFFLTVAFNKNRYII